MSVTLGVTPYSDEHTAVWLLHSLGGDIEDQSVASSWYLDTDGQPEGLMLLAYSRPEYALLRAQTAGEAPVQALANWATAAQVLLNCFKANRGRALLVELSEVSHHPELALERLAEQWSLDLPSGAVLTPEMTSVKGDAHAMLALIAESLVRQSEPVQQLITQLKACTLPLAEGESLVMAAVHNFDQLAEWARQSEYRLGQLPVLESQLKEQQQQVQDAQKVHTELEAKFDAEHKSVAALQQDLEQARHQTTTISDENQLLLEQLHLVQEEFEQQHRANTALTTEKSALAQQLEASKKSTADLQAQLKQEQTAHKQTSAVQATLQGQFDSLQATFTELQRSHQQTEQQRTALEEENQLLLEQLHLVQEELEQHFHQTHEQSLAAESTEAALTKQLNSKAEALHAKERELTTLQRRLHKLHDRLDEQERSNKALNGNIAELKNRIAAEHKHRTVLEQQYQASERTSTLALATANSRIRELSNELNQVTSSTTWKLARPFLAKTNKSRKESTLKDLVMEVEASGFFDRDWYLSTYEDVAKANVNPVEHYLQTGVYEGRNPNPSFDTVWYLSYYSDVNTSGLNPLVHYIRFGRTEQRATRSGALASLPAPEGEA